MGKKDKEKKGKGDKKKVKKEYIDLGALPAREAPEPEPIPGPSTQPDTPAAYDAPSHEAGQARMQPPTSSAAAGTPQGDAAVSRIDELIASLQEENGKGQAVEAAEILPMENIPAETQPAPTVESIPGQAVLFDDGVEADPGVPGEEASGQDALLERGPEPASAAEDMPEALEPPPVAAKEAASEPPVIEGPPSEADTEQPPVEAPDPIKEKVASKDVVPAGPAAIGMAAPAAAGNNSFPSGSSYLGHSDYVRGSGKAAGALVCGILSIFFAHAVIVGVILGIVALVLASGYTKRFGKNGLAMGGKACGIIGIVISIFMFFIWWLFITSYLSLYGYLL